MKFKKLLLMCISSLTLSNISSQGFKPSLFEKVFGTGEKNFQIYNKTNKDIRFGIRGLPEVTTVKPKTAQSDTVNPNNPVTINITFGPNFRELYTYTLPAKPGSKYFMQLVEDPKTKEINLIAQTGLAASILGKNIKTEEILKSKDVGVSTPVPGASNINKIKVINNTNDVNYLYIGDKNEPIANLVRTVSSPSGQPLGWVNLNRGQSTNEREINASNQALYVLYQKPRQIVKYEFPVGKSYYLEITGDKKIVPAAKLPLSAIQSNVQQNEIKQQVIK